MFYSFALACRGGALTDSLARVSRVGDYVMADHAPVDRAPISADVITDVTLRLFLFLGHLLQKKKRRRSESTRGSSETPSVTVFFLFEESPHRRPT